MVVVLVDVPVVAFSLALVVEGRAVVVRAGVGSFEVQLRVEDWIEVERLPKTNIVLNVYEDAVGYILENGEREV